MVEYHKTFHLIFQMLWVHLKNVWISTHDETSLKVQRPKDGHEFGFFLVLVSYNNIYHKYESFFLHFHINST
jgi:hypothetical protein